MSCAIPGASPGKAVRMRTLSIMAMVDGKDLTTSAYRQTPMSTMGQSRHRQHDLREAYGLDALAQCARARLRRIEYYRVPNGRAVLELWQRSSSHFRRAWPALRRFLSDVLRRRFDGRLRPLELARRDHSVLLGGLPLCDQGLAKTFEVIGKNPRAHHAFQSKVA